MSCGPNKMSMKKNNTSYRKLHFKDALTLTYINPISITSMDNIINVHKVYSKEDHVDQVPSYNSISLIHLLFQMTRSYFCAKKVKFYDEKGVGVEKYLRVMGKIRCYSFKFNYSK